MDLDQITTLGFRGEALASIAAVSQVTILTCPRQQQPANYFALKAVRLHTKRVMGSPPGTLVTIENLFYNVPVRLKFLRQPQTETGHIHDVVAHYAMAYPMCASTSLPKTARSFNQPAMAAFTTY